MEQCEFQQDQQFKQPPSRGNLSAKNMHKGCVPAKERVYDAKHLWERHHIMKRMCIAGASHKDIATATGVSQQQVSNILNSALMKRELELARASLDEKALDIAAEIKRIHPKAMKVLENILDDLDAPITLKAKVAMDNLSRGGYSPVVRGSLDITHSFSREELDAIKADALAAGVRLGDIVECDFTEERIGNED